MRRIATVLLSMGCVGGLDFDPFRASGCHRRHGEGATLLRRSRDRRIAWRADQAAEPTR